MKYTLMVSVSVLTLTGIIFNQNSIASELGSEVESKSLSKKTSKIGVSESKIKKPSEKKSEKKVSQILDVTFNTDAKETSNSEKGLDTQIWYFLTYKISEEYKARLWVDIKKDLADSYEEKLNDTRLTFSKKGWDLTDKLKLNPSVSIIFPTSEKSKRNEELNTGIEINPSFSYQHTEKLSFSYLPRLVKNFHEYKTSRTNKTNTEYKTVQFYVVSYSLTDKWTPSATLIYVDTWSYSGRRRDPSYLTNLELEYSVNKTLSLAAGTLHGGSVFDRQNGPDENIALYDENETTLYGKFALKF